MPKRTFNPRMLPIQKLSFEQWRSGKMADTINNLRSAVQMLQELRAETCEWTHNELDDFYETQCGEGYCFIEGTPKHNKVKFCPFCGRILKTK